MDAKTFRLGFDGGKSDPYNITESRSKFQGSIWMGLSRFKWLLEELNSIRQLQQTSLGLFHFFRDGYRTLEISGMKNNRVFFGNLGIP
jgi:hypothetical protein